MQGGALLGSCPSLAERMRRKVLPGRAAVQLPPSPLLGLSGSRLQNGGGGARWGAALWLGGSLPVTFLALVCSSEWSQKSLCVPVLLLPLSLP